MTKIQDCPGYKAARVFLATADGTSIEEVAFGISVILHECAESMAVQAQNRKDVLTFLHKAFEVVVSEIIPGTSVWELTTDETTSFETQASQAFMQLVAKTDSGPQAFYDALTTVLRSARSVYGDDDSFKLNTRLVVAQSLGVEVDAIDRLHGDVKLKAAH
jgi:hypothetical protein